MTMTMDPSTSSGNVKVSSVPSGVPGEQLTELGANLRHALDGQLAEERATARSTFPAEHLHREPGQTIEQAREWVLNRLRELDASGFGSAGLITKAGEAPDPAAAVLAFEMLSLGDLSTLIKSGVQFGLFGGAVSNLGTSWHHDTFMPDITSLKLLGCFAMTELGHGSDVAGIETTITFVPETDEFEVNSETPEATKAYIGNAARDGSMAVVFGQLLVRGRNHGVHVILVPIRDAERQRPARRDHRRPGPQGRPARRRQRHAAVRAGPRAATDAARPLRRRRRHRHLPGRDHQPEPALLHHARDAGAWPRLHRRRWRDRRPPGPVDRDAVRAAAAPVHRSRPSGRHRAARLPDPPAATAAGGGQVVRARLRPERAHQGPRPHPGRRGVHRARPAGAGDAGRRAEGDHHPVRQRRHPVVPRGVRRGRLPLGERAGRAAGRRRHLRHVRGRQHRPAAAGGQGPAHRVQAGVGRPRPRRHGAGHRPRRRPGRAGAHRCQRPDRPARRHGPTAVGEPGAGRPCLARVGLRGARTALAGVAGTPHAPRVGTRTSKPSTG